MSASASQGLSVTVTEYLGRHATQRPDPLLKQHKLSFSHLQALAPASPAASSAHPFHPCFFPALVPVPPLPGSLPRFLFICRMDTKSFLLGFLRVS